MDDTQFTENIKKKFSLHDTNKWTAIKIEIELQYNKDDSISLFSDYLMELGDDCTSFFFLFNYEVDMAELNKLLGLNVINLFEKKNDINTFSVSRKTTEINEKIPELNERFEDFLIEILETALDNNVYFTDTNYEK